MTGADLSASTRVLPAPIQLPSIAWMPVNVDIKPEQKEGDDEARKDKVRYRDMAHP